MLCAASPKLKTSRQGFQAEPDKKNSKLPKVMRQRVKQIIFSGQHLLVKSTKSNPEASLSFQTSKSSPTLPLTSLGACFQSCDLAVMLLARLGWRILHVHRKSYNQVLLNVKTAEAHGAGIGRHFVALKATREGVLNASEVGRSRSIGSKHGQVHPKKNRKPALENHRKQPVKGNHPENKVCGFHRCKVRTTRGHMPRRPGRD